MTRQLSEPEARCCANCGNVLVRRSNTSAKEWAATKYCKRRCHADARLAEGPQRFWERVEKRGADECWPWTGATAGNGYGTFRLNGRQRIASRVAWILTHGEEAEGFVCHSCDNPICCNPAHLWKGTALENNRDRDAKGRGWKGPRPKAETAQCNA